MVSYLASYLVSYLNTRNIAIRLVSRKHLFRIFHEFWSFHSKNFLENLKEMCARADSEPWTNDHMNMITTITRCQGVNKSFCVVLFFLISVMIPLRYSFDIILYATGNTLLCGRKFEHAKLTITMYVVPKKHFLKICLVLLKRMLQKY